MVYDHKVKAYGKYYQAWESVPDDDMEGSESFPPYSDSEIALETQTGEKKYTKSEINRMNTTELQNLAESRGIEGAFNMSGVDLKKRLIADMGL